MSKISHDSETPAPGKQVITACAFIHHNFSGTEKVFLPKRAVTKKFLPGVFELPGGHIDFGEDIVAGLKRELIEELEMNIIVGDPFYVFTYFNGIKGSHSIEVDYFATFKDNINKIHLNPEDHSEYGWFSKDEIKIKVVSLEKLADDPEIKAIYKGFSLMAHRDVNFG